MLISPLATNDSDFFLRQESDTDLYYAVAGRSGGADDVLAELETKVFGGVNWAGKYARDRSKSKTAAASPVTSSGCRIPMRFLAFDQRGRVKKIGLLRCQI